MGGRQGEGRHSENKGRREGAVDRGMEGNGGLLLSEVERLKDCEG